MIELLFGTLNLIWMNAACVVVCADSRGHSPHTGEVTDSFQKVFQCGEWGACAISGLLTAGDLNISKEVGKICNGVSSDDSPQDVSHRLARIVGSYIGNIQWSPDSVGDRQELFLSAVIRRDQYRRVTVVRMYFPLRKHENSLVLLAPQFFTACEGAILADSDVAQLVMGDAECLPMNLAPLETGPGEVSITEQVDAIYARALATSRECAKTIGGPIDIASLNSDGFRWLRRKPLP